MKLAPLFKDHMVLQQSRPIPVWGTAEPGATVSLRLGDSRVTSRADASGAWRALLPGRPAGGPYEMTASDGVCEWRARDVMIGEVWLCSGQSNMAMQVASCNNAQQDIASANDPLIRVFTVARVTAMQRRDDVAGAWSLCSPETAGGFSAVAYYFARELRKALGVAVGLVDSSWGGTMAEAWTSRQGLLDEPLVRHYMDAVDAYFGPEGEEIREKQKSARDEWQQSIPKDTGNAGQSKGWHKPDLDEQDWKRMDLPIPWQTFGLDFSGVLWFRRAVNIPPAWAGRDLELHIGACDKRDYTYFNGEFLGSFGMEDSTDAWHTPRVYVVPGVRVKAGRQVLAVRVFSEMYQGGMIGPAAEMWCAPKDAPESERMTLTGQWLYRVERNFGKISTAAPAATYGEGNANTPTVLFNGMIAPLVPYAFRGCLWYQGESNVGREAEYSVLLSAMIRDWRREFGQGALPFYIVQLANFMARHARPTESGWAQLREAQRMVLDNVPNTGLAVAVEIGDAQDIHPKNKQDVGRRLASLALARDYGRCEVVAGGPMPAIAWRDAGTALVRFDCQAQCLVTNDARLPVGFALAGADRVFYWAEARIMDRETIALSSRDVPEPGWVRYAWADNPDCNLAGSSGLPAVPFEIPVPFGEWLVPSTRPSMETS